MWRAHHDLPGGSRFWAHPSVTDCVRQKLERQKAEHVRLSPSLPPASNLPMSFSSMRMFRAVTTLGLDLHLVRLVPVSALLCLGNRGHLVLRCKTHLRNLFRCALLQGLLRDDLPPFRHVAPESEVRKRRRFARRYPLEYASVEQTESHERFPLESVARARPTCDSASGPVE